MICESCGGKGWFIEHCDMSEEYGESLPCDDCGGTGLSATDQTPPPMHMLVEWQKKYFTDNFHVIAAEEIAAASIRITKVVFKFYPTWEKKQNAIVAYCYPCNGLKDYPVLNLQKAINDRIQALEWTHIAPHIFDGEYSIKYQPAN